MLLAKEEAVLQGVTERLIEIGRRYGMEMNEEKFFYLIFIVPPVLLQTINTLRSLLMACRRWIQ